MSKYKQDLKMKSVIDNVDLQFISLYKKLQGVLIKCDIGHSIWSDGLVAVECPELYQVLLRKLDIIISIEHKDYLIEALGRESDGCLYYVKKSECIEDYSLYFCKRSRVSLPESRENDRFYYDYKIRISFYVPIKSEKNKYIVYQLLYSYALKMLRKRKKTHEAKVKSALKKVFSFDKFLALFISKIKYVRESDWGVFPAWHGYNFKGLNICNDMNAFRSYNINGLQFRVLKNGGLYSELCCDKNVKDSLASLSKNMAFLSGPEELRRVQLIQLDILKEVKRICKCHEINYFLCSGTLLGAVRHSGFIPWDYDIDVAMLKEDYDKFINAAKNNLNKEKYFLRTICTEKNAHITYAQIRKNNTLMTRTGREHIKSAHQGVLLDIFPVYKGPDSLVKFYLITKLCMFFKTALWTKSGFKAESKKIKIIIYGFMKKYFSEIAYDMYIKLATRYSNHKTKKVMWLVAKNNPYLSDFTNACLYEKLKEIEFEGELFSTISEPETYLQSVYTDEYMLYPLGDRKLWGFNASMFSAGNEYMYEFNSIEREKYYARCVSIITNGISGSETESIRKRLSNYVSNRKICIYGAGVVTGPALFELLSAEKYKVDLVIDGDENKFGRMFLGKVIESGKEVKNKDNYIVFIAVRGSAKTELEIKNKLKYFGYKNIITCGEWLGLRAALNKHDYNIMSEGSVDNFSKNSFSIKALYNLVYDEESLASLNRIACYRKAPNTVTYEYYNINYFPCNLIDSSFAIDSVVDCGACKGDVFDYYIKNISVRFNKYYMIEMDPLNICSLRDKIERAEYYDRVVLFELAVSDRKGAVLACLDGSVGSKLDDRGDAKVNTDTLDNILGNNRVDLIKMDIEGAEYSALKGGESVIKKNRPILSISLYHCDEDLWQIPIYINSIVENYCYFIRCEALCDYILYAIPSEKVNKEIMGI